MRLTSSTKASGTSKPGAKAISRPSRIEKSGLIRQSACPITGVKGSSPIRPTSP